MEFLYNQRLGWKVKLPKLHEWLKQSAQTPYVASFDVFGAKLWNSLPKDVNTQTTLENLKIHLGRLLSTILGSPPFTGYKTTNSYSILDWSGGIRKKLTALQGPTEQINEVQQGKVCLYVCVCLYVRIYLINAWLRRNVCSWLLNETSFEEAGRCLPI